MAQLVKNPTMCELWVQSLGWEDPGEEGIATHLDILAWRISMNRGAWLAAVQGGRKELDMAWQLSTEHILFAKNPVSLVK